MQIATTNNQYPPLKFEPTYHTNKKETETMFVKLLRKFFWMSKSNHGHSIHHLSDHLKRDMGLIERDLNPKPTNVNTALPKTLPIRWV